MKTSKKYLFPFILAAMVATVSGCDSNPTNSKAGNEPKKEPVSQAPTKVTPVRPSPTAIATPKASPTPSPTPSPTASPSMAELREKPTPGSANKNKTEPDSKALSKKSSTITLYTSDSQCESLVPKKVEVTPDQPVASAVGKILEQRDTADLSLSSYRVNVKDGTATVDLRVAPDSKRQLASLSSCEQFALFQSVEKTLTSNPQWNIKNVRFTEKGEEIPL